MDPLTQARTNAYKKALETRNRKLNPYDIIVRTINNEKNKEEPLDIDITFKNLYHQFEMSIVINSLFQLAYIRIHKKGSTTKVISDTKPIEEILSQIRRMLRNFYIQKIITRTEYYTNYRTIFECGDKECPRYKEIMENPASKIIQDKYRKRISLKKESAKKISDLVRTSEGFIKRKYSPEEMKDTFEEWVESDKPFFSFGKKRKNDKSRDLEYLLKLKCC
jgi:hypothetical protein